jgi:archaellum component FlaC
MRKQTPAKSHKPRKSGDIFVTKKMLFGVRDELKSDVTTLRLETRAGFKKVDARFNEVDARFKRVDARFNQVDARFNQIDARFDQVDAKFNEVHAQFKDVHSAIAEVKSEVLNLKSEVSKVVAVVHRIAVQSEEQNARNIFVLDGYTSLSDRMTRLEKKRDKDF